MEDTGGALEPESTGLAESLEVELRASGTLLGGERSLLLNEGGRGRGEVVREFQWVKSSALIRDTRWSQLCSHSFTLEASASASVSSSVLWAW